MTLKKECYICKNLWGDQTYKPRLLFSKSVANDFYFIKVYLGEKVVNSLKPRLEKFKGKMYGRNIECAWLDEKTAKYSKDYICEYHVYRKSNLKFLGYEIDQWISLNLQFHKNKKINACKNINANKSKQINK